MNWAEALERYSIFENRNFLLKVFFYRNNPFCFYIKDKRNKQEGNFSLNYPLEILGEPPEFSCSVGYAEHLTLTEKIPLLSYKKPQVEAVK